MTEMSNVWSIGAQQYGFNIGGFCTSLDINRCWALQCVEAGWSINGVVYSSFDSCGSDQNLYGYYVRNARGVAFIGCGAESNLHDGWLLRASDAEASGIMVAAQNIYGLALTGCYGFHNGTQTAGQFANLIAAVTANNRSIEVVISGCNTEKATTNDPSVSVNGASGQIKITEQACKFDGTVFTTGSVLYEGRRFSFTPTVAGTTAAGAETYTTRDGS